MNNFSRQFAMLMRVYTRINWLMPAQCAENRHYKSASCNTISLLRLTVTIMAFPDRQPRINHFSRSIVKICREGGRLLSQQIEALERLRRSHTDIVYSSLEHLHTDYCVCTGYAVD